MSIDAIKTKAAAIHLPGMSPQVDPATKWIYTFMDIYELTGTARTHIARGILASGANEKGFDSTMEYWYPRASSYSSSGKTNLVLERTYGNATSLNPNEATLKRSRDAIWDEAVSVTPDFKSTYTQNDSTTTFGFSLVIKTDPKVGPTIDLSWFNSQPSNIMKGVDGDMTFRYNSDANASKWYRAQ